MSRDPGVQELVSALVGTWTGEGEGGYPTLEPFRYREVLEIEERPDHPALHYEQRTWKKTPAGEEVSHWETGLLRISSDGSLIYFNAQGGRGEAMTGSWERHDQGWRLHLRSDQYAGDDRVRGSMRELTVDSRGLTYEVSMMTKNSPEMGIHLRARLAKRP